MEAGDAEEPLALGTLVGNSVAQGEVEGSGGAEMEDEADEGAWATEAEVEDET